MYNHVTIIQKDPTQVRLTFRQTVQVVFTLDFTDQGIGKTLKHPAAGPVHNDEIIGK